MRFANETIIDKEIKLFDNEVNFLGPNLIIKNCNIISNCNSKALSFNDVKLVDTVFDSKVLLKNFEWNRVCLEGVTFIGHYSGCDFGSLKEFDDEVGHVMNCNFSQTVLDGCRFMNCNPETIVFPKWPCFTILEPNRHSGELKLEKWPGDIGMIMEIFTDSPSGTSAVTGYATEIVSQLGGGVEDFKAMLRQFDYVML